MVISIKCYATLAPHQPEQSEAYPIEHGETIHSLLNKLGLRDNDVKLAFHNGKHATLDTPIQDGDRLALFPAVGGG